MILEYFGRLLLIMPLIGGLAWGSLWLWKKLQIGLPLQSQSARAVRVVARDEARLREHLHRLKASCAFVGAAGLLDAARALHAAPADAGAHARFQADAAAILSGAAAQS